MMQYLWKHIYESIKAWIVGIILEMYGMFFDVLETSLQTSWYLDSIFVKMYLL